MPTFQFTSPDGKNYSVNGPDGATPEQAFQVLQTQIGGGGSGSSASPIGDDRAATVAALRGIPLAGAYVDKGAAMLNAVAQPFTETGLSHADNYADRAAENEKTIKAAADKYENDHPIETGIGKTVVGAGALAPLGATALGARAMGMAGEALLPSILKGAASFGALNGVDAGLRGDSVGKGLVTGALGGAAGPLAGKAIELGIKGANAVATPIISNIRARINPADFAESQIGRAIHESGMSPDDIAQSVSNASRDGQGVFTMADAMGDAGHNLLGAAARGPGDGRTAIVNALDARQAGQSRRVANALSEGFDTPQTAAQTEARMTAARGTQANADYGAVRDDAQPVDVSNVLDHIDQQVAPFGVPHDRIAPDGITGRMLAYRKMLGGDATNLDGSAAGGLNDFNAAQMVRHDLSDEVQKAVRGGEGNRARLLGGVLRQLDTSLENSSAGFRDANANFSRASRNIDAIGEGRSAALKGRTEDTIPAFRNLSGEGQQAFRAGYADPLIAEAQASPFGTNAARKLTSAAFTDESAAMAPMRTGDQMSRRLRRENTMFEGRNTALGGSPTAKNLAHDTAAGVDPHLVMQLTTGNWHGALGTALRAGHNAMTGNTPEVRKAVADILLQNGTNVSSTALRDMVDKSVQRIQFVQALAKRVGNGAGNGLLIAGPSHKQNVN